VAIAKNAESILGWASECLARLSQEYWQGRNLKYLEIALSQEGHRMKQTEQDKQKIWRVLGILRGERPASGPEDIAALEAVIFAAQ
jgi:hypothetical protein